MRAVIMQPTYLPWVGYFDLVDQSDVFIFLDTVQFEKQSWQQRNRIKTAQGPAWLTVPVFQSLQQSVKDVAIRETTNYRHKHWMSVLSNYRRAPAWAELSDVVKESFDRPWEKLADLNIHFITTFAAAMKLETRFVRSSEMPSLAGRKGDLLIEMCREVGADTYLSPMGSRNYLNDDTTFRDAGIRLEFHGYEHPTYPQLFGDFVPFMSALDLMFNVGATAATDAMRSGRRKSLTLAELPPLVPSP
jgi:hypothetical protein